MFAYSLGFICGTAGLAFWQHFVKRGKKHRTPRRSATVIDIDADIVDSVRYDWRPEKVN